MYYLLLAVILISGLFLTRPLYSQEPPPLSENLRLEEYGCAAFDPASFQACLDEAELTSVPFIKITGPIVCDSASSCSFELKNIKNYLMISPTKPENRFIRKNDFSYTILKVENSSNIEFRGLTFEDEGSNGCPVATTCPAFMTVSKATDIIFNKVSFLKTSNVSLLITDARNLTITDSIFKDSFKSALEIRISNFTDGIKISNNKFENNAGSGLVFQAVSARQNSIISGNTFTNNHSRGAYSGCIYPCIGAQMKIVGQTGKLRIADNTITGGENSAFDSLGLYASGIEVSGQNVNNTTLFCNEISQNRGSGVVQAGPFQNTAGVIISENKIWGNGVNLNIPTVTADTQNCYTKECTLSCRTSN